LLNTETAGLQIKVVVEENQIVGGELALPEKTFEGRAGEIHEVEGTGQFN
jgi:hypothetical protein